MFYRSMIQSFCTKDKPLTKIFPISTKLKDIYSKTYKNNGLSSDINSNDQKNYYKKIKIGIATSALLSLGFAALIYPLITGKGQKLLNNLIIWADTSENSIIKAARSILLNPKINIEDIDQKAVAHMFTAIDNFDGLGKNGVNGAHHLYAFIKSFYKTTIKDNIQITSIKMRDKKNKDGKIIIEYLVDGIKKTLETDVKEGFTRGQQRLLRSLSDPKANNGHAIKNFTKSNFYKTYLSEGTEVKASKSSFSEIYETLFCSKPTGVIDSIQKDPFLEGIYNIKYHKLSGKNSYPDKTVFIDSPISPSIFQDFLKLCSKKVDESIKEEIKNGANLYNSKNLVATVEKALRRGIIANSNAENTTILAHRAGTMFVAYCEKTDKGSYRVRSFFPVLHGSHMHKDIMREYLKSKGKICLSDIPKLIGLKNLVPKEFYYNYLGSLCKKSIYLETMFLSQLQFMQLRKQKNMAKQYNNHLKNK